MSLSLGANITIFVLVGALLHKPHNVVLLAGCVFTSHILNMACNRLYDTDRDKKRRTFVKIVLHLWLGRLFYFYQGNSNSLASIDLNAGYVGLNSFNFTVVGVFLTLNTFSAQILCNLLLLFHLFDDYYKENSVR
jgi:ethanolamine phosphate transferase 2 subunit G